MKLAIPLFLLAATTTTTTASSLVLSPALTPNPNSNPNANLPSDRFKVSLTFSSTLLLVNETLANVNYFMNILARSNINDGIYPRSYSAPDFKHVEITSDILAENRFLLWGIYLTITDMVKYIRFNNVVVVLLWDSKPVGQLKILAKTALSLPGTYGNSTDHAIDNKAEPNEARPNIQTTQTLVKKSNTTPQKQNPPTNNTSPSPPPLPHSPPPSLSTITLPPEPASLTIDFAPVPGSTLLKRNSVFLSFYAATLHVANYPVNDPMRHFRSEAPGIDLSVHMYEAGTGCSYGQAISALAYVPIFMMEHPGFGYREVNFNVRVDGVKACRGSIIDSLLAAE